MKHIILSAVTFSVLVFASLAVSPAQAQSPYGGYAVVGPQVVVVNGGYAAYPAYRTISAYGYGNYGLYATPNYGFAAPYGAGYIGGYQPYQQMYYQRMYYGLGY